MYTTGKLLTDQTNAKTIAIDIHRSKKTQQKSKSKSKNLTDEPGYYAKRMREYRKRKRAEDKTYGKQFVYAVEINGIKYCFLNPKDVIIEKIDKRVLNDNNKIYVKAF